MGNIDFDKIDLKPMSWQILSHIVLRDAIEPEKAEEIAAQLGLNTKQINAAVTKSLVRYGFIIRQYKLTRLMKREYAVLTVTDRGRQYVEWRQKREKGEQ